MAVRVARILGLEPLKGKHRRQDASGVTGIMTQKIKLTYGDVLSVIFYEKLSYRICFLCVFDFTCLSFLGNVKAVD